MVTDLSTIPLLPPQDEEYARQLQSELYAMSDIPDRHGQISAVSLTSLMSTDTRISAQFIHQAPCT